MGTQWMVMRFFVSWKPRVEWIPVGRVPGKSGVEVKATVYLSYKANVYR